MNASSDLYMVRRAVAFAVALVAGCEQQKTIGTDFDPSGGSADSAPSMPCPIGEVDLGCYGEGETQFLVRTRLDRAIGEDGRLRIDRCQAIVDGLEGTHVVVELPCAKGMVPFNSGTFAVNTTLRAGSAVFGAVFSDTTKVTEGWVARGMGPPVAIVRGGRLLAEVFAAP